MSLCIRLLICVMMVAFTVGHSRAQSELESLGTGELELQILQFGAGNVARQGSWAGILVSVRDFGLNQREVLLRVRGYDPDGDTLRFDRVLTTNPGVGGGRQSFWLYTKLSYNMDRSEPIEVLGFEALEDNSQAAGELGFIPGKLLGSATYVPQQGALLEEYVGMYGVVGNLGIGLDGYGTLANRSQYPATSHEQTQVVKGLTVPGMPDAWHGLDAFDVIAWGGTGGSRDPGALTTTQAVALREWVRRGGHFVVVLPSAGQEWTNSTNNPIADLLPSARVSRREGVDLEPLRALFTVNSMVPMPINATLHTFKPLDGAPANEAIPILTDASGDCLVMRRVYGLGLVTVIGIDFEVSRFVSPGVASLRALPEPEVFWNRVLGRRGMVTAVDAETARMPAGNFLPSRQARVFDHQIAGEIAKSGTALKGLLLGVVLFFVFWVVAGPGGYATLAHFKLKRMAWVGFLAASGVFTLVAWSGAFAMRPKSVDVSHFSMSLQVHGSEIERTRMWASVLIPQYGTTRVQLDGEGSPGGLISPFQAASFDLATTQSFPDNRDYRMAARNPSELSVPSRATVKPFEIDWSGVPRRGAISIASMPGEEGALQLIHDEIKNWWWVQGELVHDYPGELTDLRVVVVRGLDRIRSNVNPNQSYANVNIFEFAGAWQPGQPLSLSNNTNPPQPNRVNLRGDTVLRNLLASGYEIRGLGSATSGDLDRQAAALWLMGQFPPADFGNGRGTTGDVIGLRRMTHGLDLSDWFSQPCVIVLANLVNEAADGEEAVGPVPLLVNGREPPMTGRSSIAWVYPLPAAPPEWSLLGAPLPDEPLDDP